ncbi:uncharacterized protein FOBCDRAFT_232960 [Fusarium oxysporum Fo47]|uniref:Uncharacterized protein n=1 Tax=Fusarium oxysporum Fo47 TaxID=660027 RepID=W9JJJ3_FUSOX|nr:uncharacterized protein FOBCDRAFT_232960 [Fusarium oxysporum Fo47]EWZ29790.1 hypothetical protein FOZG_16660 [Fusarium oxysporum Fo47]QKD61069.1 hypothetical protein FOBCDRAFT_232960 [Fusarium oxysporum Fo47]
MASSEAGAPQLLNEQPTSSSSKRPRAYSENSTDALQHEDYTIGWISALPLEMTAAEIMLDHIHQPLPQHPQDGNTYTLGSINEHNVVIACLPKGQYGTNNAATVANDMNRSFPNIQHRLMVGIGGGAPKLADVRLGDIVVSNEVVQSDLGKLMPNDQFQRTSHPVRPPHSLMTAVSKLQACHNRGQNQMPAILSESISQLTQYARPSMLDRLFKHDYDHPLWSEDCSFCDQSQLVTRPARQRTDPFIHYGRIASGNQVIKDGRSRDTLSEELGAICFEMEAAGLIISSPCLVVRGICDYSDSHKNKKWQEYAALVAAAYAKELVTVVPSQNLQSWKRRKAQVLHAPEPTDPRADECREALFVTDPSVDRELILDTKGDICEGTCEWILSTDEFQTWDQTPPHLLWISAPPGMGKTFMSIYLSKRFKATTKGSETATIYFFCDNNVETRNTAVNILRSLIYQLISHQPRLINVIIPQWKQQSHRLFQDISFSTLWKIFEEMIGKSDFNTIYCIIDALDECETNSLSLLLRKFERLSQGHLGSSPKMKLVCLSRRYPDNIPEALLLFAKMELDTMIAREEDISRFISSQVQELAQKKKLNREMRSRLEETFKQKSEGTFLWVSFMAQDLQKQRLLDFEASLEMLPAGLDAVYDRILQNIDLEKREIIQRILYWTIVATRPFDISELCEAADIKPIGLLTREEVCIELIRSCGHLLQITYGRSLFHAKPTVKFLHQSAKDYLIKFERRLGLPTAGLEPSQLHEHATITLIRYLEKIDCHLSLESPEYLNLGDDFPLIYYAVDSWSRHFKELKDITQVIQQGASFFEEDSEVRLCWQRLYRSLTVDVGEARDSSPIPLLHLSALLALNSLTELCLRCDGELDIESEWSEHTALVFACKAREGYIATLLLDAGADAVARCSFGINALETAVIHCDRDFLQLMARRKSFRQWLIEQASSDDGGLLNGAASNGNEDGCRFLVEDLGWDLNWENGRAAYSALCCAIESGNYKLISCFMEEWGVPAENHWHILDKACSSYASDNDFEQIIRLLVDDYSVDINATDWEGRNALYTTFGHNFREFSALFRTRILLQFGCSPDQPDRLGRRPLHYLAMEASRIPLLQFLDIMEFLVHRSQHGVNQQCLKGQTVLHYLIEDFLPSNDLLWYLWPMEHTVKGILDLGLDRNIQNSQGLTGLKMLWSALERCEERIGAQVRNWRNYLTKTINILESYHTVPRHYDSNWV